VHSLVDTKFFPNDHPLPYPQAPNPPPRRPLTLKKDSVIPRSLSHLLLIPAPQLCPAFVNGILLASSKLCIQLLAIYTMFRLPFRCRSVTRRQPVSLCFIQTYRKHASPVLASEPKDAVCVDFEPYLMTPLDHSMGFGSASCYPSFMFSFRLDDPKSCIPALENGISRLVRQLPFLAGELVPSSKLPGRLNVFEMRPPTRASLERLPMLLTREHPNQYLWRNGDDRSQAPSHAERQSATLDDTFMPFPFFHIDAFRPALRFQANILADGIVLDACFNHMAMDAVGITVVLETLAACCRATAAEEVLFSANMEGEAKSRRIVYEAGQGQRPGEADISWAYDLQANVASTALKTENIVCCDFLLSSTKIQGLKDRCNALLPDLTRGQGYEPTIFLSTNDVITAVLWLCITRTRLQQGHQMSSESVITIPVNSRRIFQPPVSEFYIGNAAAMIAASFPLDSLKLQTLELSDGLKASPEHDEKLITKLALAVRSKIRSTDQEYINNIISRIRDEHDWCQMSPRLCDVTVSNISSLDFYKLDFGPRLGKIQRFDFPLEHLDGSCYIKPRQIVSKEHNPQAAPWDIYISLDQNIMHHLEKDGLFVWLQKESF
jgi:fumigaclavine B O-acetyltransferase